jgi:hypothetical protein
MAGKLVQAKNGQFVKGQSGNPEGRPKGSKNRITVQKLMIEEAFRDGSEGDIAEVLKKVVAQALEGDKASQKLIWDANISKQTLAEDKAAGTKQSITVHTMNVKGADIEGDFEDVSDIEETIQ